MVRHGNGSDTERDAEVAETELANTERDTPPAVEERTSETSEVVGRFIIEAPLGSGGMGDVYRAHDPVLDRAIALKVLRTNGQQEDPAWTRRLLREARAAAALSHPNTVTVFDVGDDRGRIFIAMELLEGSTLRAVLRSRRATFVEKMTWLLQAARALLAAHERGLVHRDVKPDNMFVCADGTLKLLDFGIAKRGAEDLVELAPDSLGPSSLRTVEGRRVGTPRYMAPEQLAGKPTDGRTDQFAWGLVAVEVLTGVHARDTPTSAWGSDGASPPVALGDLRVPAELFAGLDEELRRAIARALAPRKEERFPTMAPIVEVLSRLSSSPAPRELAERREPSPVEEPRAGVAGASAAEERVVAPRPASLWRWAFVLAIAASTVGALVVLVRARPTPVNQARAASRPPLPSCAVGPSRSLHLNDDDRIAVLQDHRIVIAPSTRRAVALHYESSAGPSFSKNPVLEQFLRNIHTRNTFVDGLHVRGDPFALIILDQGEQGSLLFGAFEDPFFTHRLPGRVTAFTMSPFEQEAVIGVSLVPTENPDQEPGAAAYRLTDRNVQIAPLVETGVTTAPAIGGAGNRVAFAYVHHAPGRPPEAHLAILDEQSRRVGPIERLASVAPDTGLAVAFTPSGATVAVFLVGERRRLEVVTFALDRLTRSPSTDAVDDLALAQPRAAPLPYGKWLVAWLAPSGSAAVVRAGLVADDGHITEAFTVATVAPAARLLQLAPSIDGVDVVWGRASDDGVGTVATIASLRCPTTRD